MHTHTHTHTHVSYFACTHDRGTAAALLNLNQGCGAVAKRAAHELIDAARFQVRVHVRGWVGTCADICVGEYGYVRVHGCGWVCTCACLHVRGLVGGCAHVHVCMYVGEWVGVHVCMCINVGVCGPACVQVHAYL